MLRYLLFILMFIGVFKLSYAQQNQTTPLKGVLLSGHKSIDLSNIQIENLNSRRGTITNEQAEFEIAVKLGDSLRITALHIETTYVEILPMHLNDKFITIEVEESVNLLDEVVLKPLGITGVLGIDQKLIKTEPVITSQDLGGAPARDTRTYGEKQMYYMQTGSLDMLYGALSGDLAKAKRRIEIEYYEADRQRVLKKVSDSFYENFLGIDKIMKHNYLAYCERSKTMAQMANMPYTTFIEFLLDNKEGYEKYRKEVEEHKSE